MAVALANDLERPHLFIENVRFIGVMPPSSTWFSTNEGTLRRAIFKVAYEIANYGRSPAIIKERAGGVFIGRDFPFNPSPNPNDVWKNEFAMGAGDRRGPFTEYVWRSSMTHELLNALTINPAGIEGFVRPDIFFFIGIKYENVQGLADEVGVLWEFNVSAQQWVQEPWTLEKYPNYTYRKLGARPNTTKPAQPNES